MRLFCSCINFLFLFFSFFQLPAQSGQVSYRQLKEYEGTYEYINHTTLQIAASPKDNVLYALVGDSKYKLRPSGKDTFLNNGNQQVIFSRDQSGVTGYTVKDGESNDHFKIITHNVTFSEKIWYARPVGKEPFTYHYQIPANKHDGIATGPIW